MDFDSPGGLVYSPTALRQLPFILLRLARRLAPTATPRTFPTATFARNTQPALQNEVTPITDLQTWLISCFPQIPGLYTLSQTLLDWTLPPITLVLGSIAPFPSSTFSQTPGALVIR